MNCLKSLAGFKFGKLFVSKDLYFCVLNNFLEDFLFYEKIYPIMEESLISWQAIVYGILSASVCEWNMWPFDFNGFIVHNFL